MWLLQQLADQTFAAKFALIKEWDHERLQIWVAGANSLRHCRSRIDAGPATRRGKS